MINYEIGGKLKSNKRHPFIYKDVEYLITEIFDKCIYVEYENNSINIPKDYISNYSTDFTYIPPKKCKVCGGNSYIDDLKRTKNEQTKGNILTCNFIMPCPDCMKLKEEKIDFTSGKNTEDINFKISINGEFEGIFKTQEEKSQPKFKVGDKVRILSDPLDTMSNPLKYLFIGKETTAGTIGNIYAWCEDLYYVSTCLGLWWYKEDQLEKLIPITESIYNNLKSGDRLICIKDWGADYIKNKEYKVLEGNPTRVVIEHIIDWIKPEFEHIFEYFMLIEPKEEPKVHISMDKGEDGTAIMRYTKDDNGAITILDIKYTKPKKTKAQIRDIIIEELKAKGFKQDMYNHIFDRLVKDEIFVLVRKNKVILNQWDNKEKAHEIFTIYFNAHKSINKFLAKVDELLKPTYTPTNYKPPTLEPIEYVSFSKALEWLKEGYTVARLRWGSCFSMKFQLDNPIVIWYCDGKIKDNLSSEDIMANDWYWVKKPGGK